MNPLPKGKFVSFQRLPHGTTEEELSKWFHEHGLAIGPECISVRDFLQSTGALVSIQDDVMLEIFNWVLNREKFEGIEMVAVPLRK